MDELTGLIGYLAVSSAIKYIMHYTQDVKVPRNAKKVGTLKTIRLYPVKSMGILKPENAECTYSGLVCQGVNDRQWLLITADSHKFVTARAKPKMVRIRPSFHGDKVHFDAEGMSTLVLKKTVPSNTSNIIKTDVWGQRISGVDVGDEAAVWMDRFIEGEGTTGKYRLIQHTPHIEKRVLVKQSDPWQNQSKPSDSVLYHDCFPFMLISTASLEELSQLITQKTGKPAALDMDQFRPNFEIEGCKPFDEDNWQEVFIGDAKFTQQKRCDRCIMTTVDADRGEKREDGEPLKTLKRVRPHIKGSPLFGVNFVLDRPGAVSVGQPVYAVV